MFKLAPLHLAHQGSSLAFHLTRGLARAGSSDTRCRGRVEGRFTRWLSKPWLPQRLGNVISRKRLPELSWPRNKDTGSDKPEQ
jgi:hypothetical protein